MAKEILSFVMYTTSGLYSYKNYCNIIHSVLPGTTAGVNDKTHSEGSVL